jgi:D-psicose/D-tagatose/L-ribulose 3-epimerase
MNPRLSFFGFSKDIDAISAAGYDCIEMHMHEIMKFDESDFQKACQHLKDTPLVCEILDNPVPLDQCIADESFDLEYYRDFLNKGADRASKMGVKYYVFGNGKTRSLPASGDIKAAREKNLTFMRMMADIVAKQGITILLEPLAPRVSNVILGIPEALDYINLVGKPNLGTFIDYRWFLAQNHPFQDIEKYGQYITHVHIDNPTTEFPKRLIPRVDDGHDYSAFFQAINKINYSGIISIEANTFIDFDKDLKDGIAFFNKYGITPRRISTS